MKTGFLRIFSEDLLKSNELIPLVAEELITTSDYPFGIFNFLAFS
jgi:hypothetical protein